MSGRSGKRSRFLFLPLLLLATTAARAEQTSSYVVSGPIGAALWGLGNEPGTQAIAFAFTHVTPVKPQAVAAEAPAVEAPEEPKLPPPGPRLAFSVTQWVLIDDEWVRRQWFGDVPLTDKALVIAANLAVGTLDATVPGTLEEHTEDDVVITQNVPGRIQVQWSAFGRLANTTLAYTYQTPSYAATLQTAGSGRMSRAAATVTVEALGEPIEIWGLGTLSAVKTGLLSVTQELPPPSP
jgi:hypothetical protein